MSAYVSRARFAGGSSVDNSPEDGFFAAFLGISAMEQRFHLKSQDVRRHSIALLYWHLQGRASESEWRKKDDML